MAEYVLAENIPGQLHVEETRLRKRVAELEQGCVELGICPTQDARATQEHRTHLLAEARENLLLIEERIALLEGETDVPLQLTKAARRWRARIAELENEIGQK